MKKWFRDRLKLTSLIFCLFGLGIGYTIGVYTTLDFCVDTGLKLLKLDGVINIDFSDAMKGILKYYSGEWV